MLKTYNRLAAGERLRLKRTLLGLTQDEVAEIIDRSPKYYADIERGNCGMSIETLISLSYTLHISIDELLSEDTPSNQSTDHTASPTQMDAIIEILESSPTKKQKHALNLLKLFIAACRD